jgi:hypothetical protein
VRVVAEREKLAAFSRVALNRFRRLLVNKFLSSGPPQIPSAEIYANGPRASLVCCLLQMDRGALAKGASLCAFTHAPLI